MTGALTLARGLWHRAGTSLVIFVVALCATAAAAIGPTYYVAARDSILQDTMQTTSTVGRAYQASQTGGVRGTFGPFAAGVDQVALDAIGSPADQRRLFAPPIQAIETTAFFSKIVVNTLLVWRSDVCAHLRLRSGHCPTAANDVMVSRSLADVYHWRVGQTLHPAGRRPLHVTAIYQPPQAPTDYWFARGSLYFPAEFPSAGGRGPTYDALFTPRSTIEALTGNPQGTLS
ncbi:MAG TPA: hypothetical protein VFJ98_07755, partial [Mycobacteriales bacterium]|nr:hypothetical protein [Mycobacteriales bacterium]